MKKGIVTIPVCILLLISSLVIVSPVEAVKSSGNTLYVGGSGPGNYTKIQDAIDNASDGDNVYVYIGIYYENVVVNKSLNLIGENKSITIIDGKRDVIKITHDYVTVSGFTIKNDIQSGIHISSSFNTISENIITSDKASSGIQIIGLFNLITSNIIYNYWAAIELYGFYNTISRNLISNNTYGISLFESLGNKIYENYITHNIWEGITICTGIRNIINRNSIEDNGVGINITTASSGFNVIKNNNFFRNSVDATFTILLIPSCDTWLHNYWGNPKLFPKIIIGTLIYYFNPFDFEEKHIPWVAFDLLPALIPNDIPNLKKF